MLGSANRIANKELVQNRISIYNKYKLINETTYIYRYMQSTTTFYDSHFFSMVEIDSSNLDTKKSSHLPDISKYKSFRFSMGHFGISLNSAAAT